MLSVAMLSPILASVGCNSGSPYVATTVPTAAVILNTPSGLVATATAATSVTLTWVDSANDESQFTIFRSLSSTTSFVQIGSVTAGVLTYVDSSAAAATAYQYEIYAGDAAGDSSLASNVATVTTPASSASSVPATPAVSLVVSLPPSTAVSLIWSEATSVVTGFNIERSTDGTNYSYLGYAAPTALSYTDSTLSAGQNYYYKLYAYNTAGNSAFSNIVCSSGSCATAVPPAPTNLVATLSSSTSASLTWSQATSVVSGFNIERSTNGSTYAYVGYSPGSTFSFTDTSITAGQTYYYLVYAFNAVGNSGFSNQASVADINAPTCSITTSNASPIYGYQSYLITMATSGTVTSATFGTAAGQSPIAVTGGTGPFVSNYAGQIVTYTGTVTGPGGTNNCSPVTVTAQGGFSAVDYFYVSPSGPGTSRPYPYGYCPSGTSLINSGSASTGTGLIADATGSSIKSGNYVNGNISFCQGKDYLSNDNDNTQVLTYFAVTPEGNPFSGGNDGLLGSIFGSVTDCLNGSCVPNKAGVLSQQFFHYASTPWSLLAHGAAYVVDVWMMPEDNNNRGLGGAGYCPKGYGYITDFVNGYLGKLNGNQTMCMQAAIKP
jgi:hypothetical protein